MRAQAVKAEAPAARSWHRLELAANAIAPRIVHTKHRRVGRQPQSRARPRLLDDLPLELELVLIRRVLQLAPAARAEMVTFGRYAMRRRLDHTRGRRHRHTTLLAPRLRLHHLVRLVGVAPVLLRLPAHLAPPAHDRDVRAERAASGRVHLEHTPGASARD